MPSYRSPKWHVLIFTAAVPARRVCTRKLELLRNLFIVLLAVGTATAYVGLLVVKKHDSRTKSDTPSPSVTTCCQRGRQQRTEAAQWEMQQGQGTEETKDVSGSRISRFQY